MLNAGRMLSNFDHPDHDSAVAHGVNAKLRIPYTFARLNGQEVTLEVGTPIHVDEHRGIGSHGVDHFEVEPTDYIVTYSN